MKRLVFFLIIVLAASSSALVLNALAQPQVAWVQPVNLSQSGSASSPVIAVAPDGILHTMWWDKLGGAQYAQGTVGISQTVWAKPATIPSLWGERRVITNTQTGKVTVSLTAPQATRLIVDVKGITFAVWLDALNQVQTTQNRGAAWGDYATTLSDSAVAFDVMADLSDTVHLAYLRPTDTQGAPAGIYYRSATNGAWSAASLVYASPYFRVRQFEDSHLSIAGDGLGRRIIAWDDARLGRSYYAYSTDQGQTWSDPQLVTGNESEPVTKAYAAISPDGEFMLFWQDPTRAGCVVSQRRSADSGKNWHTPERILTDVAYCPGQWTFEVGGDKRLWLIGTPLPNNPGKIETSLLAAWDGQAWSDPVEVSVRFRESSADRTINLGCVGMALAGERLGVIGCDGSGDVWAASNNVGLARLMPALKSVWQSPLPLSVSTSQGRVQSLPAVVAAEPSKFFAMWSQSSAQSTSGVALYISSGEGATWSRAALVLQSPPDSALDTSGIQLAPKAEQPALAADNQNRLHAVWSGGVDGQIFYSWAYVRDATSSSGWSTPIGLPAVTEMGSWPDIAADPRGEVLHVLYAIPYNEGRGIYYVRSDDGGSHWSKPKAILDAAAAKWTAADKPRLALDANANILHAVWLRTGLPDGVEPQAVYYARSTDNGKTWSEPVRVAEGLVDWPRVAVVGPRQVLIVWNQANSGSPDTPSIDVWSQFSSTGGDRWSTASRVSSLGQISGPTGLASDGTQAFLVGMGEGTGGESTLLHTRWDGQTWEGQERLALSQNYTLGNAAAAAIAPKAGTFGAVMRISVKQAGGDSQFEVWATERDVSVLPAAAPAPTFTPLPTSTALPTATPRPTATPKPQLPAQATAQTSANNPLQDQAPLIWSGVLAILIITGALVIRAVLVARR